MQEFVVELKDEPGATIKVQFKKQAARNDIVVLYKVKPGEKKAASTNGSEQRSSELAGYVGHEADRQARCRWSLRRRRRRGCRQ